MRNLRKFGAALLVAGVLVSSVAATTMPVLAADTTTASVTAFCDRLNSFITWLNSLPESPLRDALLQYARAVCARYCPSCS